MTNQVSMIRLSQSQYDALEAKDADALYFTSDTHRIYRGTDCYSLVSTPVLDPGGGQPGQVLVKTADGYGWVGPEQFLKNYEMVLHLPLSVKAVPIDTGQAAAS